MAIMETIMVKRESPAARRALGSVKLNAQKKVAITAYRRRTSTLAETASGLRLNRGARLGMKKKRSPSLMNRRSQTSTTSRLV